MSVRRSLQFDIIPSNGKTITIVAVLSASEKLSTPRVNNNQKLAGVRVCFMGLRDLKFLLINRIIIRMHDTKWYCHV